MAARKNPLWLLIIFSFLIVYCGVHFNLSDSDWYNIFEKHDAGTGINYLYAATDDGIYAFRLDSGTGALYQLNSFPYYSPSQITQLGASQNNGSLLLAGFAEGNCYMYGFPINTDGTLGIPGITSIANTAMSISVEPYGRYVYYCLRDLPYLYGNKLDYVNKVLMPVSGLPFSFANGSASPATSAVSPDGKWLFAGLGAANTSIQAFQISSDGILTPKAGAAMYISDPASIVVHPSGEFVYVCAYSSQPFIYSYAINADGSLYPIGSDPALGTPSASFGTLALDASGQHLFGVAFGESEYIRNYTIDATGAPGSAFMKMSPQPVEYASELVSAYGGRFLYLACNDPGGSGSDRIRVFEVSSDGNMQELTAYTFVIPYDFNNYPVQITDMLLVIK
jgi:6-phosphogluconolactonase (cycloisomerase 2 family)